MFTIIICDEQLIQDCKESYRTFLSPMLDRNDYDFVRWNTRGDTVEEAVPELKKLTQKHKEWRGIIISDRSVLGLDGISKENPFDICEYVKSPSCLDTVEEVKQFRDDKERALYLAVESPLAKLTNWLMGASVIDVPEPGDDLLTQMKDADEAYIEKIRKEGRNLVETELDRMRLIRDNLLRASFSEDPAISHGPKQLVLIAERAVGKKDYSCAYRDVRTEFEYSSFYEDNLYPNSVRYILYNMKYIRTSRDKDCYFNFLVFVNLLAGNTYPNDALKPYRVYRAEAILEKDKLEQMFGRYLSKLCATKAKVDQSLRRLRLQKKDTIDNYTAQTLFESDCSIPVKIDATYSAEDLFCQYNELGLSTDCPGDEKEYWEEQYREIVKSFPRYVREHRRAIKKVAKGSFRDNDTITDERALKMNEFQRENIHYRLAEEEARMVETRTQNIFNTEEYLGRMDEASKQIRNKIGQRMTRKTTVLAGLSALLLYFIGFIPFLVDVFQNHDEISIAVGASVLCTVLLAAVSLIMLFLFRRRLVSCFQNFNDVMGGIIAEIEGSLESFSTYFSHACNVMREFSVIDYINSDADKTQRILVKHGLDIERTKEEICALFTNYIPDDFQVGDDTELYDYDFYVEGDYRYEMPYPESIHNIDFLQYGNKISVPVDYVKEVTLEREELYD